MKKNIRLGIAFILALMVSTSMAMAKELPSESGVSQYKEWRVEFNDGVNPATVDGKIYIEDKNGYKVPVTKTYEDEGKTVVLTPQNLYDMGATYTINVLGGVKSFGGEALSEDIHKSFSTALYTPWSPSIIKTGENSISLNWFYDYEQTDCKYYIYESSELDGEYMRLRNEDGGHEWTEEWSINEGYRVKDGVQIANLTQGQTKYYKIAAVKNGIESEQSEAVKVTMYSSDDYINFIKSSRLNGEDYDLGPVFEQYFKSTGYEHSFNTYGFEPWAPMGDDEVVFTGVTKEGSSLSGSSVWNPFASHSSGSEIFQITFKITEYDNGVGSWKIKGGKLGSSTLSSDEAADKLRLIYDKYQP